MPTPINITCCIFGYICSIVNALDSSLMSHALYLVSRLFLVVTLEILHFDHLRIIIFTERIMKLEKVLILLNPNL